MADEDGGEEDQNTTGSDPASENSDYHPEPDPNAPRHKAALILAWSFAVAYLLIIMAEMIRAVYYQEPVGDTSVTLMLTIGSLLVGLSSGYLVRNINTPPGRRYELQTRVGTVMVATLGGMLIIMAGAHLTDVLFGDSVNPLSENALNVLVVLLGGIIGALGSYLGVRTEDHGPPSAPPK